MENFAIMLESYMLPAEEGIRSYFRNKKADKAKLNNKQEELRSLEPMEVAKKIVNAIKDELTSGPEAEKEINVLYDEFVKSPGKVNPTVSQKVTISGIPCILCTNKNKESGEQKFQLVAVPFKTQNDTVNADVISLHYGAQLLLNKGM